MELIKISYFQNCRSTTPLTLNVDAALQFIQKGTSKDLIERIRLESDQSKRNMYKQCLPAVTFGGYFNERRDLREASGFACLDFDKVVDLKQLSDKLKLSEYIFSYWISPSGNGLKALVKIPVVKDKEEYREYYRAILEHFKALNPDKSTKDINRLCFESYDPDLYVKEEARVFSKKIKYKPNTKAGIKTSFNLSEGKIIDRLIHWWVDKFPFAKGNRNSSLFVLACALSTFGIKKSTTIDLFNSFEEQDFTFNEILQIIDSAYKKAEFNSQKFSK